jgi:transcriptional regulator with XRE-family HTH domain
MTGAEFREVLTTLGLSQREFARRFDVHESQISRWIGGTYAVPRWVPLALAQIQQEQETHD